MGPGDVANMVIAITVIGTVALSIGFLKIVSMWTTKKSTPATMPTYDPEAIARLQASIDAISIEVERISEGQRFTTRLLNERVPAKSAVPEQPGSLVGQ
jgi:hypothetical protein